MPIKRSSYEKRSSPAHLCTGRFPHAGAAFRRVCFVGYIAGFLFAQAGCSRRSFRRSPRQPGRLYVCNHVLDIPIGYNGASESPWTQTSIDEAMLERTRSALRELHNAGLLTDAQLAQSLAACTATDTWRAAAAPGGLIQVSCTITAKLDEDSYSSFVLNLVLTSADTPVYFNYQNSQEDFSAADAELLQSYCALLGLDSFADWQYPDWGGTVQNFGAAAYSESSQVYLTANCYHGITLSAASMPPQDYAVLDTLYAKGDTP